eukprot:2180842-Ditylum_brightwellii.AAC.1
MGMSAEDCLGLVLLWKRSRGLLWPLLLIFGMTLTSLKRYLMFGKVVLLKFLKTDSNIQVRLPAKEQVMEYVESIASKYSLLGEERVFAAADGLKLYLEQSYIHAIQNAFYNG